MVFRFNTLRSASSRVLPALGTACTKKKIKYGTLLSRSSPDHATRTRLALLSRSCC